MAVREEGEGRLDTRTLVPVPVPRTPCPVLRGAASSDRASRSRTQRASLSRCGARARAGRTRPPGPRTPRTRTRRTHPVGHRRYPGCGSTLPQAAAGPPSPRGLFRRRINARRDTPRARRRRRSVPVQVPVRTPPSGLDQTPLQDALQTQTQTRALRPRTPSSGRSAPRRRRRGARRRADLETNPPSSSAAGRVGTALGRAAVHRARRPTSPRCSTQGRRRHRGAPPERSAPPPGAPTRSPPTLGSTCAYPWVPGARSGPGRYSPSAATGG